MTCCWRTKFCPKFLRWDSFPIDDKGKTCSPGTHTDDDAEYEGTIEIPNLSEENEAHEIDVSSHARQLSRVIVLVIVKMRTFVVRNKSCMNGTKKKKKKEGNWGICFYNFKVGRFHFSGHFQANDETGFILRTFFRFGFQQTARKMLLTKWRSFSARVEWNQYKTNWPSTSVTWEKVSEENWFGCQDFRVWRAAIFDETLDRVSFMFLFTEFSKGLILPKKSGENKTPAQVKVSCFAQRFLLVGLQSLMFCFE